MKIIEKSIESLIPYEFNNKIHDEVQINRIANSIKEFGFTQPVVIDKNNIIIIGHGRIEGAKKLGLEKVPCVVMDDLTEAQIKKLRILDNKLNESDYDLGNLKLELDTLDDFNFGDLTFTVNDLFPEFEAPDFDPDEYLNKASNNEEEEEQKANTFSLLVTVKDEGELEMLKKDLNELGYTNYK